MEPVEVVERRADVIGVASAVKWYVIGIAVTAMLSIVAVVLVSIFAKDATAVAAGLSAIAAISTPVLATLLGLNQRAMAIKTDGHFSLLLQSEKQKERIKGIVEGSEKGIEHVKTVVEADAAD